VVVPARVVVATDAGGFIAEGSAIPVRSMPVTSVTLVPHKLSVIIPMTAEMSNFTNALRVITQMGGDAMSLLLDKEMLSATASSSSRPAGLGNGLTPVATASAGVDAMSLDIGNLVNALSAAGGGANPIFVAAPGQAAAMKQRCGPLFDYPILPSSALSAGTVMAIEASGVVSAVDPAPKFVIGPYATLQMEDSSPAPLATGTGPTIATPIRSLTQTNVTALKIILRMDWSVRAAGMVQIVNSVTW
jgi:hypothetical protein